MDSVEASYQLGQQVADLESRYGGRAARAEAVARGQRAAENAREDEAMARVRLTYLTVDRYAPAPREYVVLNVPGRGVPLNTPRLLHAMTRDAVSGRHVDLAATREDRVSSLWRLLDTPAGRELGALVSDGVEHVADLDDEGRLVARVLSSAELLQGVAEHRDREPIRGPGRPLLDVPTRPGRRAKRCRAPCSVLNT